MMGIVGAAQCVSSSRSQVPGSIQALISKGGLWLPTAQQSYVHGPDYACVAMVARVRNAAL